MTYHSVDVLKEGWLDLAVRIFKAAGFVVVLNVLSDEACADVLETCKAWEENMLRCDPDLLGNRDPGRYSMGAASQSRALLHEPAWRNLLDNGAVLDLLECIFLEQGFHFCGGGGDFVIGRTKNFQALHSDLGVHRVPDELRYTFVPPKVAVNFTVQRITESMGPMRIIPGRMVVDEGDIPPVFARESQEMRESKLCPIPPGAGIFRDLRTWHGGTPNQSPTTRFLPSVEVVSGRYLQAASTEKAWQRGLSQCLPQEQFETLSGRCQNYCRAILTKKCSRIGVKKAAVVKPQRTWEKGSGRGGKVRRRTSQEPF